MGTIFLEGFDKYGPIGENSPAIRTLMTQSEWTSFGTDGGTDSVTVVAGLSSSGRALQIIDSHGRITKGLPANYSRIIGGMRISGSGATANFHGVTFTDGGTAQFSVGVNNATGTVAIRSGGGTGTAIDTTAASLASSGSTHYLEWDVTIGTSATYHVYFDGVQVLTGTTGNTRAGTSNNQVNGMIIGILTGNGNSTIIMDDIYIFDTSGSVNNAPLLTNPRIETRYPSSDSQTQWTNAGNTIVPAGVTPGAVANTTTTTNAPGAAILALMKITPAVGCSLQSVGMLPQTTSGTAKFKAVLYSDSSGSPNSLVATGTEVTGSTAGTALTLPFSAGQTLTGGTSYWIGFIGDTSVNLAEYETSTTLGQKKTNTYASGAPGTATSMTTGQASWMMWGNATGASTNWESVNHNPADAIGPAADNGTISSSTVNNEDLYGFPALSGITGTVYSIGVKANVKRSDAGARTIDLRMKSSSTDGAGNTTGISPGTSYGWTASYFDTDPNTSAAWGLSAANAATAGPKIAS